MSSSPPYKRLLHSCHVTSHQFRGGSSAVTEQRRGLLTLASTSLSEAADKQLLVDSVKVCRQAATLGQ